MTRTIWNTLATLAMLIFTALPLSAAEVVTYYHNDHLGSPIAATDDSGTVVWQQAYGPWGAKLTVNTDERGYTGNWLDEETGLADHKARWYTSSIGRFTGIDPVKWHETNIHSFNRYSYSGNNPYTNTDVGGELFFSFHMNRRDMSTEHAMIAGQVGNAGAQTAMGLHAAGSAAKLVVGGAGSLLKMGMKAVSKKSDDLISSTPGSVGRNGEIAVQRLHRIGDKVKITVNGRARIPDGLTRSVLSEVKNVKKLSFTRQLRDFADYAERNKLQFDLYVRPSTQLSGPLKQAMRQGRINPKLIPGAN